MRRRQQTALAARAGRLPALARGVEPSRNVLNSLPVGGLPAPARRHARGGALWSEELVRTTKDFLVMSHFELGAHALGGGRAVHAAAAALPAGGRVECARGLLARRPAHGPGPLYFFLCTLCFFFHRRAGPHTDWCRYISFLSTLCFFFHRRAGPHTDWCNLTLLFQRPGNAGLERSLAPRLTR